MVKVFCSRCRYYVPGDTIPYSFGPPDEIKEKCMCPENFYNSYVSENIRPKSKPSVINRFNNCQWFEPIGTEDNIVYSLNGIKGDVILEPGDNIEITKEGKKIKISCTGGGGGQPIGDVVTSVNGETGDVNIVPGNNVDIDKDEHGAIRVNAFPPPGPMNLSARVVTSVTTQVLETDCIIWFDSEAAGNNQTLILPDMQADSMSIVVRHLGGCYPLILNRNNRIHKINGDGTSIAIDWVKSVGEWYWRQAY